MLGVRGAGHVESARGGSSGSSDWDVAKGVMRGLVRWDDVGVLEVGLIVVCCSAGESVNGQCGIGVTVLTALLPMLKRRACGL